MSEETEGFNEPAAQAVLTDDTQQQQQPEIDDDDEISDDTTADAEPKKAKGVQKRIDELTHNWREAERRERDRQAEAEHWRQLALRHATMQQQQQAEPEASEFDEFDYSPEAIEARARQAAREEYAQMAERERTSARVREVLASTDDADARRIFTDTSLPITREMADVILASESPDKLSGYLGRNLSEVSRIAALPPHLQAYELAKIEARATAPQTVKPTAAPAPIPTVTARGAVERDPDKMSVEEWTKWRNQQVHGRT